MPNDKQQVKPYEAGGSKKEQVSRMFNSIARRYDLLNRLLSAGIDKRWRKRAISLLAKAKPQKVLDIATGTADVAIALVRQLDTPQVVGLDIAEAMLEIGRKKISELGLNDRIELLVGDAEHLPFPSNTFDALTVSFGVRNFENLQAGLQEMHRVLKPQAEAVILEFSKPRIFPLKQIFHFYFKNILPLIGRWTSKDPRAYHYLYESVQAFPDGEDFLRELEKAGFRQTKQIALTFGICSIYYAKKNSEI
ncbi:MAG TPA: bifunctional demethylmenaquinone methyltransferase/2-methoxy-6-polyprenyl-1,4-benzoquinol methylase UbiE [Phaeodactylibacter sp.]|nr:bifunctional demethylmenaquinone methyltransferase/2-methoxy-6-polyprenyl-1,4-benzoquinol methylase UbiE [Phaeodactylibacter sp.]